MKRSCVVVASEASLLPPGLVRCLVVLVGRVDFFSRVECFLAGIESRGVEGVSGTIIGDVEA
jgi:hypothetical protein